MSQLYRLTTGYRLFALLVSICVLIATQKLQAQCNGCSYRGASVITNGNFSSGNTGFSSQYKYNSDLYPEGNYYIGTDPKTYHGSFVGKDHTTGTGKFMIINGSPNPGTKVWCQTITVTPNTNYDFSTWVCSVHPTSPALLQFTVNGTAIGAVFQAPSTTNTWKEFYYTWNSGANTSVTICIENMSTIASGNDFGIDDITFSPCLPYNVTAKATAGPDVKACYSVNQTIGANSTATNISYNWSPATYLSSATVAKPTVTYTNTGTSPVTLTYILTVDSAGLACTTKDTVLVTVYPDLGANLGADKRVCNTSVNLVNSITADSLKWSTGATTSSITVNQTGNYTVTLYRWGCTDKDTIGVIIDTVPTFSLPADIYFCEGKDTIIKSPYTGLWNTGVTSNQITVNSPGTYYQTRTNGTCSYTDTINVYKLTYPVVNLGPDKLSCTGGSFTLNAGQSGTWQNGSVGSTFTASTSGTYFVKVYNQQCMSTDTIKIGIKNVIPVDLPAPQTVCVGTPVTLSFAYNGTPTFLWSTGATTPTINVTTSGTYWVKLTDSTCTSADTTQVTFNSYPVLNLPPTVKICNGNDTLLSVPFNAAYTYSWNTGAGGNSVNASTAGNYIVTVSNGPCVSKDTTQLIVVTVPTVTLPSLTTICKTGSLTLNGSTTPGYTNLWSTGSTASSISVNTAGTYSLTVTNDICSATASSVLKTDTLPLSLLPDSLVFCENASGNLTANASGSVGVSWSNGQSGNSINVNTPGTYKVTLTNGQCTLVDSAMVKVDLLPVSILPDSVIFCENSSGNLLANSTSGIGVTWSTGATGNSIAVSTPGWFKVTLKRGTCTVVDSAYSKVDLMPAVSLPAALKICNGRDTSISVSFNPAYSYLWNTGSTSNSINTNLAGTYSVAVTNGTCTKTVSTLLNTVTVPDAVLPDISVICKTSSLTLNGSTIAGYLNKWSTGATTSSITVTTAGSYMLTVTNDICSDTAVAVLKVDTVPVSILPDTVVFCENSPAQLKANATPGIGVSWSNGATTNAINVSSPGIYKVTLQNGTCSVSDSAVAKMDLLPVSILPDSLIFCENVSGTLQANSTAGVGVTWNTGATTNAINVTSAGKYIATLVRGLCTVKDSAIVKVDVMPVVTLPANIKVCQGVDTGLTVSYNPAYTYLWSNGVTSNHINISTAGIYNVMVKNGSCTKTGSATLTTVAVPDADLPPLSTICKTGSVTLNGSIMPGYTNLWSNGSTASSITVSAAGTYSLIVTNDICKDTSIGVVKVDTVPISTLPDTLVICENGSGVLHANTSNGAGILWSTGATTDAITVTTPGVYKLTLINGECSLNDSTIVKADLLPVSILPDSLVFCENVSGTLTANSTPGVNVSWSTGTTGNQISVTAPGKYTATLVRGMCTVKDSAVVKVDSLPLIGLPPTVKVCTGVDTGLTVNLNPAYSYLWNTGATGNHISITTPGTYSVTVKNGTCTSIESTNLTNVTIPDAVLPPLTAICVPASATLTGATTPGYINKWSTGVTAPSITVTQPGTYSLVVINDICSDTAYAVIKVDTMPVTSLPDSLIFCENAGSSILNAHGEADASVLWSTGATTDAITVTTAGKYKVTLTRGACIATDSTVVKVDLLPVSILPDSLVFCENVSGTLQANETAGVNVSWNTGAITNSINVGAPGMYKATLVRGTCTVKDSAIVKIDKLPLLNLPPALKICAGDDTTLIVTETPGYNYTWRTGSTSNTITINTAGTYLVTVKNGSCTAKDSTKLSTVVVPNITLPSLTTICENSSLTLNGSTTTGFVNNWSTGSSASAITVNQPGTYTLTVTNDICSDTAQAVVKTDQLPLSVLPDSIKICENSGGTLTANATPGVGVQWSTGQQTDAISVSTAGTYVVTLTKGVCSVKDSAKVKQVKLPVSILPDSLVFCDNISAVLKANNTPGIEVQWNTGATTDAITVNDAGKYLVTLTNDICSVNDSAIVKTDPYPVVLLPANVTICSGTDTTLVLALGSGETYNWNTGSTTNSITVSAAGTYIGTAKNGTCTASDTCTIVVIEKPVFELPALTSLCENDSIQLKSGLTSSFAHKWNTGATGTAIWVKTPGIYSLTVENGMCSSTETAELRTDKLPVSALPPSVTFCENASAVLNSGNNPGSVVNWSNGATSPAITITTAGIYYVTITNGKCVVNASVIAKTDKLPLPNLPEPFKLCSNKDTLLRLDGMANYQILWSTGETTSTIRVKDPGDYSVSVTNKTCVGKDSTAVVQVEAPIFTLPVLEQICETEVKSLESNAKPQFKHLWTNGSEDRMIKVNTPGIYGLSVTNDICTETHSTEIKVDNMPVSSVPAAFNFCENVNGTLVATSTSGANVLWSTGATTNSINVSTAGNYTAVVSKGKCKYEATSVVTVDKLPAVDLPVNMKICEGSDTTIAVTMNPAFSYNWSNGATGNSIKISQAGKYNIKVTNGSCVNQDSTVLAVVKVPVSNLPDQTSICSSDSLKLTGSATSGYTNSWSTGESSTSIFVKNPGTYFLKITNDICSTLDTAVLKVDQLPQSVLVKSLRLCEDLEGELHACNTNVTVIWSTGDTTSTIKVNQSGTYGVKLINGECSVSDSAVVKVDKLPLSILPDSVVFCENSKGTLRANATPGITVNWNTGSVKDSIVVNQAGIYTVELVNGACKVLDSAVARVDVLPVYHLPDSVFFCNGLDTTISVSGKPGWTFLWSTGASTADIKLDESGKVGLEVRNGSCVTKDTITVKEVDYPVLQLQPEVSICITDSTILDPKASPSYTYKWNDGTTRPTLKVKTDGTYSVEVWNRECLSTASVVLTTDAVPQSVLVDSAAFCENAIGQLSATSSPNTSILWNTGETTNTITPTKAGKYSVTITNGKCVANDSATVKIDEMPIIDLIPANKICQGDSVQVKSNGLPKYQYNWSNSKTTPSIFIKNAGDYILKVNNGLCAIADTTTLVVVEVPNVSLPDSLKVCETDSVLLSATSNAAYNHSWNNGASGQSQTVNTAGNYILTVSNDICKAKDSTLLIVNKMPAGILPDSIRYCEGGPTQLTATSSPFTSVSWNTGQTGNLIQTAKAGLVTATITNGLCVKLDSVFITIDPKPGVQLPEAVSFCEGGDTILSYIPKDNETIKWSTGSTSPELKVNAAGMITLIVQNLSCKTIDTTLVSVIKYPVSTLDNEFRICQTDSIYMNPGGMAGCKYEWNTGAKTSTIWAKNSGWYSVVMMNGKCAIKDSAFLANDTLPVFTVPGPQRFCQGDTVHISLLGNPNYYYKWNSVESADIDVTTAGVYAYTVTNGKCTTNGAIPVKMDLRPNPALKDQSICAGDTAKVIVVQEDSVAYRWNDGVSGPIRSFTDNGNYILVASRGTCTVSDTMNLEVKPVPVLRLPEDFTLCTGDSLHLSAGNDPTYTYTWKNENGQVIGKTAVLTLSAGNAGVGAHTYTVTATALGCVSKGELKGNVYAKPTIDAGPDIKICADSAKIMATGTFTNLRWNDGKTDATRYVRNSGTYYAEVTNDHCRATDSVKVELSRLPNVDLPDDTTICKGNFIIFTIGERGTWSDGSFGNTFIANESGKYSVTVVKGNCTTTEEANLTVLAPPKMDIPDTTVCSNAPFRVPELPAGCTYSWTRGEVEDNIISVAGDYQLTMTNMCGSYATNFTVLVEECGRTLYFPTAFTPDQDGTNDNFNVVATGYEDIVLMIFDRFGELIYQEKSKKPSWDGSYKGQKVKTDTYEVRIIGEYRLTKGGALLTQEEFGKVTVLK